MNGPTAQQTRDPAAGDPTLRPGVHVGAGCSGFFAAIFAAWLAHSANLSSDTAMQVVGAAATLVTTAIHFVHAKLFHNANPD